MALQYIGARYVPKFYEGPDSAWQSGVAYEPLTIVTYAGNSYTSKKPVPASVGAPNVNTEYWVSTGIFNQQVADLLDRVNNISEQLTEWNGFINVKDYGASPENFDNSDAIQAAINDNPHSIIVIPPGLYPIRKAIHLPGDPAYTVQLMLDDMAILQASSDFTDYYMVYVNSVHEAANPYPLYAYFSFAGGTLDCNSVASGIELKHGRHIRISDIQIKNVKSDGIGIHVAASAINSSLDSIFQNINLNAEEGYNIGIKIDGNDNQFQNIRINGFQIGCQVNGSGNFFNGVHPLFIVKSGSTYQGSCAFKIEGQSNHFISCYADSFNYGWFVTGDRKFFLTDCIAYWYSSTYFTDQTFIYAYNYFNGIAENCQIEFSSDTATKMILDTPNTTAGSGKLIGIDCNYTQLSNTDKSSAFRDTFGKYSQYNLNGFLMHGYITNSGTRLQLQFELNKPIYPGTTLSFVWNNLTVVAGSWNGIDVSDISSTTVLHAENYKTYVHIQVDLSTALNIPNNTPIIVACTVAVNGS